MPTYCYECPDCEGRQSHRLSISSHPEEVPCGCGGTASQLYNWQGETIVRGKERPIQLSATDVPIGWENGNTDPQKQHERYAKLIGDTRNLAIANDKSAIKGGIRQIAKVPRELHRLRSKQYGKEYYDPSKQSADELKQKLRSDGLLFKN